jgi:hypothetical protein
MFSPFKLVTKQTISLYIFFFFTIPMGMYTVPTVIVLHTQQRRVRCNFIRRMFYVYICIITVSNNPLRWLLYNGFETHPVRINFIFKVTRRVRNVHSTWRMDLVTIRGQERAPTVQEDRNTLKEVLIFRTSCR